MAKNILITGATGLVGSQLTELLLQNGYNVSHIGRTIRTGKVPSYAWDIENGTIDENAFQDVDTIIHLAGAGVADKRWTAARKREILDSRIKSTRLIFGTLKKEAHQVKCFISASAIGLYGFTSGEEVFTEDSEPGTDFLAQVTRQWEEEVDRISALEIRVVKLRIGIVLSDKGGALPAMAKPIRLGVGAPLGTGKQYLSWIHLDDLCAMFLKAAETVTMKGAYNAVGPRWITNEEMTKSIATVLYRPIWLPPVPAWVMRIIIGEMAVIVINGSKISSEKIQETGFKFQFSELEATLRNLLKK
jgi:uncharacterized protein